MDFYVKSVLDKVIKMRYHHVQEYKINKQKLKLYRIIHDMAQKRAGDKIVGSDTAAQKCPDPISWPSQTKRI